MSKYQMFLSSNDRQILYQHNKPENLKPGDSDCSKRTSQITCTQASGRYADQTIQWYFSGWAL